MGRTKKKPPASVPDNDTVREEQEVTKKQCTQETPVKMKKNGGGMVTNEGMTEPGEEDENCDESGHENHRLFRDGYGRLENVGKMKVFFEMIKAKSAHACTPWEVGTKEQGIRK